MNRLRFGKTGSLPLRRVLLAGAVAVSLGMVLVPLSLMATESNLSYLLQAQQPNVSATGMNTFCPPYDLDDSTLDTAAELFEALENAETTNDDDVISISRFIRSDDSLVTYAGGPADLVNDFALNDGEGYRIQVKNSFTYNMEGDHDTSQTITLYRKKTGMEPVESASGRNDYCPPHYADEYWSAEDLEAEIEQVTADSVNDIWRFDISNDSHVSFTSGTSISSLERATVSNSPTASPISP